MFYKKITTVGNTDGAFPVGARILGARLESAAANSSMIIYDAITVATGTGREICKLLVTKGTGEAHPDSDKQMFGPNGIMVEKGISITIAGTAARGFIYYA